MSQNIQYLLPLAFIVVFYAILIIPQKRKEKKTRDMLDALKVGDNVVTIGGIYGKIQNVKDEVVTIEVGTDKTKLKIARWSIRSVETS